jgi:hypothetical protein
MIRRDSELNHAYANVVFGALNIFDIQGVLKEADVYKCGVENYQVQNFGLIDFGVLDNKIELARYYFCKQLQVPYYIIVSSVNENRFKIYITDIEDNVVIFSEQNNLSIDEFLHWWRDKQSFTQTKPMYSAAAERIKGSLIDKVLFDNKLAWGVNVDGFSFQEEDYTVNAIYEKRIATYKPPYTIATYDPNSFFFGTSTKSGDYSSWKILHDLTRKLNCSLTLFTFDTSQNYQVGATKITDVSQQIGLTYFNNVRPFENIFTDNLNGLQTWKKETI